MPEGTKTTRFSPLDFPLAAFFLAALLGVLPAYDRASTLAPLLVLAGCVLLYLLVSRLARRAEMERNIVRGMMMLAALTALFFITQTGRYDTLEKVGPLVRLSQGIARLFPAMSFWAPVANSMAALLEGFLFLAIGWLLIENRRGWQAAAGVCAGLIALALLLSQSRGAWLAVMTAGLLWLALYLRPARWLVIAGGLVLLGLVGFVLVEGDLQALNRVPVISRTLAPVLIRPDRLEVYRGSVYLLQDVPFTGIGLGQQFAMNYSRYVLLIQVPFLTYSHNFYLETWLQTGLLGLSAVIWFLSALGYCAVYLRRSGAGVLVESAWVGLAAIFIHGLTDARQYSDLWSWLPVFLLAGLVSAAWLRQEVRARREWIPAAAAAAFAMILVAGLGSIRAAWNTNLGSLHQARAELGTQQLLQERGTTELIVARAYFSGALFYDPGQRSANLRLGIIEIDREWFPSAVEHLESAHKRDPSNSTVIKALGLAYTWNGQIDDAARVLAGMVGMDQELNTWAYWRASRGQTDLSRYAYQVSLRLNPNQPKVDEALRQMNQP